MMLKKIFFYQRDKADILKLKYTNMYIKHFTAALKCKVPRINNARVGNNIKC